MQCQRCGERPAVIHVTTIVDNEQTEQHLCEACAVAQGIQTEAALSKFPVGDFLASLGSGAGAAMPTTDGDQRCPVCGATPQEFRESGRLGCSACYDAFAAPLRSLLRRIHGSSRHVGEPYTSPVGADAASQGHGAAVEVTALREQLQRAVDAENFELAARLRDEIRERE
jgi:protein arginine kinase activator